MTRVAVLDDYQGVALKMADWRALPADVDVQVFRDHLAAESAVVERLKGFDIVVAMRERTPFPRRVLEELPRLRLLITTGMRNASIDVDAATACGVLVCGTEGLPYPTAELTWALILALVRQIPREDHATRNGQWQVSVGVGLQGKTLGVIGLGRLGSQVATIGKAFGMAVLAWSQNLTAERAAQYGATLVSKDALLSQADIVTIHLVLSNRTSGLIGARELGLMKPTAYLVNTSRGPIVDEQALIQTLQRRAIAGAGLDVFDAEPLPLDHPLRRLENTVLTPHLGYVTAETYHIFYGHAVDNILAFLRGQPIRALNTPRPRG
jgi:phosphoglycerate dehydrogenase-like enzyme